MRSTVQLLGNLPATGRATVVANPTWQLVPPAGAAFAGGKAFSQRTSVNGATVAAGPWKGLARDVSFAFGLAPAHGFQPLADEPVQALVASAEAARQPGEQFGIVDAFGGREAHLGLRGAWGTVTVGRQYTVAHSIAARFQPLGNPNSTAHSLFTRGLQDGPRRAWTLVIAALLQDPQVAYH